VAQGIRVALRPLSSLVVIDLQGEMTTFAEDAVNAAYREASEQHAQDVLLNFSGVDYLNSAGIAIVIGLLTEARKSDRRLMVTGLTPHYQKIFRMMGLSRYIPMFDSEELARQSVAP